MMTNKEKKALADYYELTKKVTTQQAGPDLYEPAHVRDARIDKLKEDFTAFCEYYFPQFCQSPFAWFHKKAAKAIIDDPTIFAVLEWPRAHSKSVFADVMMPLYLKAIGELNGMIVASNNQNKAVGLLIDIQVQLEGNARYIADFGEQMSYGDWSEGTFSTRDGIGFWAFGRGQSPRGTRKAEKRPDYIVVDDIDDKEICKNLTRVKEATNWVLEDLFGCFDLKRGRFIMAGNRIHRQSILAHIVGDVEEGDPVNPIIVHIKVFALENPRTHKEDQSESGVPAWKERFTRAELQKTFAKIGYHSTQREYFHKHIVIGLVFKEEGLVYVPIKSVAAYSQIVTYVDPSFKGTRHSDFKAIIAIGKLGKYYDVLAMWVRQANTAPMVSAHYDMVEWLEEMGATAVIENWIEANFNQDTILDDYVTESIARDYMLAIRGDDRSKGDKAARIEGMSPLYERDVIRYAEHLKTTQDFKNFKDQLLGFPTAPHDDGPDAQEGGIWKINRRAKVSALPTSGGQRRDNRW